MCVYSSNSMACHDSTKVPFLSSSLWPSTADGNFVGNYELTTSHNGTNAKVRAIHRCWPLYRHKSFGQQRHAPNVGRRGHAIALSKSHGESAAALDEFLCAWESALKSVDSGKMLPYSSLLLLSIGGCESGSSSK